ncbi:hypothetical protein [Comamonas composti]|uniref:hypothetical protein n=1 Tax=Comamonas composti TaxID=408558 RepID=UPI00040EAC2C|nr:hypothetical protein [Comamonas composti]
MTHNPEFQRQLWLNWRPSLALWSLGLSLLVLALPLVLSSPKNQAYGLSATALTGLWAAAVLYGSVLAGQSLAEEARQNTWDWQRLSALSPWQMAWGKLLGATLPAWLYTLWFGLAVLVASAVWSGPMRLDIRLGLHAVLLAVLWGLALQTWAMNAVLLSWGQQEQPVHRNRAVLLPLLLVLFVLPGPFWSLVSGAVFDNGSTDLLWWGIRVGSLGLTYLFGLLTLALGLLTLWRLLCARLDIRTLPWAWPLGLLVAGFAVGGLNTPTLESAWRACLWLALAGTGFTALHAMHSSLRSWRQVQWSASQGRWRQALEALPLWTVSWLLSLVAALACALLNTRELGVLLSLQLLRDCLILTGFAFLAGRLKSPMAAFCVSWVVINIALPLLAFGIAGPMGAAALQPLGAAMIATLDDDTISLGIAWASLGLQLVLALGWVLYLFRSRVLGFARAQRS